jgi:Copper binding octapeptide repeat
MSQTIQFVRPHGGSWAERLVRRSHGVNRVKTELPKNPTVRAAIEALQQGDRKAWSELFEPDAELFDIGQVD